VKITEPNKERSKSMSFTRGKKKEKGISQGFVSYHVIYGVDNLETLKKRIGSKKKKEKEIGKILVSLGLVTKKEVKELFGRKKGEGS